MRTRCGSALTPVLNVDGLNLIQSQAAGALGLSASIAARPRRRSDRMNDGMSGSSQQNETRVVPQVRLILTHSGRLDTFQGKLVGVSRQLFVPARVDHLPGASARGLRGVQPFSVIPKWTNIDPCLARCCSGRSILERKITRLSASGQKLILMPQRPIARGSSSAH